MLMARRNRVAFPLLILALRLTQCASDGRKPPTGSTSPGFAPSSEDPRMVPASRIDESASDETSKTAKESSKLTDRQVVTASTAFHDAAIEQARIAYAKAKDPRV